MHRGRLPDPGCRCRSDFQFIHGQYVTLKLTVNGEELRRSATASVAARLDIHEIRIAVKKVCRMAVRVRSLWRS